MRFATVLLVISPLIQNCYYFWISPHSLLNSLCSSLLLISARTFHSPSRAPCVWPCVLSRSAAGATPVSVLYFLSPFSPRYFSTNRPVFHWKQGPDLRHRLLPSHTALDSLYFCIHLQRLQHPPSRSPAPPLPPPLSSRLASTPPPATHHPDLTSYTDYLIIITLQVSIVRKALTTPAFC